MTNYNLTSRYEMKSSRTPKGIGPSGFKGVLRRAAQYLAAVPVMSLFCAGDSQAIDARLLEQLRENDPSLTHLSSEALGNLERFSDATDLCDALLVNSTVTSLELDGKGEGPADTNRSPLAAIAVTLSRTLETNTTLTQLSLRNGGIGDAGVISLSMALRRNTSLESLNLEGNRISSSGMIVLADILGSTSLTTLDIGNNSVNAAGLDALAQALEGNRTLTSLGLQINSLGDSGAEILASVLQKNSTLRHVDVSANRIGLRGAMAMGDALYTNSVLVELRLDGNKIGSAGVASLLTPLLRNNHALEVIGLGGSTGIDNQGYSSLAYALESNTTLRMVHLGNRFPSDKETITEAAMKILEPHRDRLELPPLEANVQGGSTGTGGGAFSVSNFGKKIR